jgi:hypothetical protein
MDFSNTQKLNLVQNEKSRNILKLFYSQSKELIQEMRDRMTNSQSILKLYMDKLETVIKGDSKDKYLQEEEEEGFVTKTILKEQRIKYRKLHCINKVEKRMGVIELYKELTGGNEKLDLFDYNERVDQCESLNEEGRLVLESLIKEKRVICDLLEERLEVSLNRDEFIQVFLEFKSRLEGTSRENLMFLIETFRETKKIERDIDQVEQDLNNFFEGLERKSKYIIQKDIQKMKQNFFTCSEKIQNFFQSYYCNFKMIVN